MLQLTGWRRTIPILSAIGIAATLVLWYFSTRLHPVPKRPLRIGFEQNPPVQIRTDAGFAGLAVETVNEAAKRAGLQLQWVETGTSSDDALRLGLVDLWPLMADLPERQKHLHISRPWLHSSHVLLLRASGMALDQTFAGRIALFRMPLHARLLQERFPSAELVQLGDALEVVREVCTGAVAAGFLEGRQAMTGLKEKPIECGSETLRVQTLPGMTTRSGVGSTFESAGAAEILRREIGKMFRDGTVAVMMAKYSYYGLDDAWATYDLMEAAERARWVTWGISALIAALALILWRAVSSRQSRRGISALRESELRYREVFENTSDCMFLIDVTPEGGFKFAGFNAASEKAVDLSSQNVFGKFINDVFGEDIARRLVSNYRRCLKEGTLIAYEEEFDLPVGRRYFHTNLIPVRDGAGRIHRIVSVARDITERRQMEVALHASEERLRTVVSNVPIVLFALDKAGFFTLSEGKGLDSLGRSPGEIVGRSVFQVYKGTPQILDCIRRALAGEAVSASVEVAGVAFEAWYHPLRDQGGTVTGVIGVAVDITRRRQAEQQLRASEERWQLALHGSNDGLWDWNPQTDELFVSERSKQMLGYPAHELVNLREHWASNVHPDDLPRARRELQDHLDHKTAFYASEYRIRASGGSYKWVLVRGQALWDNQGQPIRMVGSQTDITERKQAEAALRESEERFRRVFEEGPLGVGLVGTDCRFLKVNSALSRLVGYSEAELTEMSLGDITRPDDPRANLEIAGRLFRREIHPYRTTERCVTKSGEIIWINLTTSLIHDEKGIPLYGLAMIADITDVKRAQEEALVRQKFESLGVLTGGIAHDFNNLLGNILSQAELVLADLPPDSPCSEEVKTIKTVAIRGAEIVRELMVYSGEDKAHLVEPVDISELVEEMLELLKISISKRAVLKTDLRKNLPAVRCSAPQIRQIVMNLVINASEAIGDRDGVISVSTSLGRGDALTLNGAPKTMEKGFLRLTISDTGCGMAREVKARIFDPFFTTKFTGRGMGLAVVQGVVRDHGGAIALASEPDEGTTFEIFLPCVNEMAQASPHIIARASEKLLRTARTVLVVEDEVVLLNSVSRLLRKRGFSVIEASDGTAAIVMIRAGNHIDAMLLDLTLPGVSSREVFEEARHMRPHLKVILTSAYSKEAAADSLAGLHVERFIRKPFQLNELMGILKEAFPG